MPTLVVLLMAALSGAGARPAPPPADAIALRDGGVILGVVADSPPGRPVRGVVRRKWAEARFPERMARWRAQEAPALKKARAKRVERLSAWRRERVAEAGAKDLVLEWIDAETARLQGDGEAAPSRLLIVTIDRRDIKSIAKRPEASSRLLKLGWRAGLEGVEEMSAADLKQAVEGRGILAEGEGPVALDDLLPLSAETDEQWQVRRAATEVANEPGLRFIAHQGLVLPEGREGAPPEVGDALGALKGLLGEPGGEDPLREKLAGVAARGRVGVVLTRLEIAPDFSGVRVESALLVRTAREGWKVAVTRPSTVRPDDLRPEAGEELAADPQVKAAFQVVEGLGLGKIDPAMKDRSLKVGAATRRALHEAQAALGRDLEGWALPVGER